MSCASHVPACTHGNDFCCRTLRKAGNTKTKQHVHLHAWIMAAGLDHCQCYWTGIVGCDMGELDGLQGLIESVPAKEWPSALLLGAHLRDWWGRRRSQLPCALVQILGPLAS